MPGRIRLVNRVVADITVAVEVLRVALVRYQRIRRQEPPQYRVLVARMIIQQPGAVQPLPGVIERGRAERAGLHVAPGVEPLPGNRAARAVAARAHRAEVVAVQVAHAAGAAHGYICPVEAVVALDRAAGLLDERAQVDRGRAADRARHALAVGVIAVGLGHAAAGDRRRQVLGRPGVRAPAAAQQVAVVVVAVRRAAHGRGRVRALAGRSAMLTYYSLVSAHVRNTVSSDSKLCGPPAP